MSAKHIVQPGEHMMRIVKEAGFSLVTLVWKHADNAKLREQRDDPNILLEGDVVTLPDKETRSFSGATEKKHLFRVRGDMTVSLAYDGVGLGAMWGPHKARNDFQRRLHRS